MIDPATLSIFVGAVMLLLLSPGPNMAFVISHGASYGWRGGVASGLGIGLADLILTALTAMGVTALVASWPPAFDLIRYAGVLYLLWLAFKALQKPSASGTSDVAQVPLKTLLIRAMLNSLLNPKALLFFMVFLPQFVNAQRGSIAVQLVLLGMVLTLVSGVFHTLLGVFGSTVSRRISSTSTFAKWQSLGLAAVLLLLAVRLALMTRPA
ncbi:MULTISPECIES: LysE family translocator [Pseudomonas]|uniref:Threonine/homoserine/homoserine lactone efflux protein n=2 Tax=Pseudomonas TaxID=286 RepID=A0ACC5M8Y9_9PSED|nr:MULTISPECIES: LysE family translocator [Pseudomonas]NMN74778.1 threonine/homoserine/homoserine lactone efflux protein [Pseudomonas sp. KD5]ATE76787.1 LysE family translocator [Pseudomonas frederiksbergensis]MBB2885136.1 threonine/homoserine/homoserine lactone efflux protein [Pseudomonas umsongensis]CAH0241618.1 Leucine efflux protein [Pseudomonas sp. Bi123]GID07075.1 lysine transporter LysE [Pseudomonas sp. 008]